MLINLMSNTDTKKVLQNSVSAVMLYCVWPANYSNEDYTTILAHEKIRGRLRIQESETWKVKISWWGEKRRMKRKSIYSTTLTLWVTSPFRFSGLLSYLLYITPPNFRVCVQWKVPANTLCHIYIQWETKVCKKPKLPSLFFILRQCSFP